MRRPPFRPAGTARPLSIDNCDYGDTYMNCGQYEEAKEDLDLRANVWRKKNKNSLLLTMW